MKIEEEQHELNEVVDGEFDMFECRPCDPVAEDVQDGVEGEAGKLIASDLFGIPVNPPRI